MNTGFLALNGQIVCVVADTLGAFHLHDSFVGVHWSVVSGGVVDGCGTTVRVAVQVSEVLRWIGPSFEWLLGVSAELTSIIWVKRTLFFGDVARDVILAIVRHVLWLVVYGRYIGGALVEEWVLAHQARAGVWGARRVQIYKWLIEARICCNSDILDSNCLTTTKMIITCAIVIVCELVLAVLRFQASQHLHLSRLGSVTPLFVLVFGEEHLVAVAEVAFITRWQTFFL